MMKYSNKLGLVIIAMLLILCIILLMLLMAKGKEETPDVGNDIETGIVIDSGSGKHIDVSTDKAAIQAELNNKVAENSICISMATKTVFSSWDSEGELNILNDESNRYLMVAEIVRQDTGEVVYKSDAIPVGNIIKKDRLDVKLDKGEYSCIAYFSAYTEDTHKFIGKTGAEILISILN